MATASSPNSLDPLGRPHVGAAAARTDELFREHGRMVAGLCRALLRDRAEAEDAAQQAFLSAHRALLNGSLPREPAAWLATIARNECVARVRTRMRTPLATDDVEQEGVPADPVDEAIRRADLSALWRAIRQLPGPQREALLLREFGGLTYDELAAALSVSESAVESLLFRARTALRTRLEPVYAALSGASWVEWLGRLFAGGSSVAAPVAAKVVALGVGAAVVTGGAVVGPDMLDHAPRRAAAADVRQAEPRRPVQAQAGSLPVFAPLTRMERHGGAASGEHAAEPGDHRHGGGESGGDGTSGGSTSDGGDGHDSAAVTPPSRQDGGHDGGNASGGESGSGGSNGGGDGGTATSSAPTQSTTTQSTTTQTTTTEPTTTTTEQRTTTTEPTTTTTLTVPIVGDDGR